MREMEKMGMSPTYKEFRQIVHAYLEANNWPITILGRDWAIGFFTRFNLKLKRGVQMQIAWKIITSDPFVIYGFYDLLELEINRLGIQVGYF